MAALVTTAGLAERGGLAAKFGGQIVVVAGSSRQSLWQSMRRSGADLGADDQGRIWYAGGPTSADALQTLTLILTLLSRGDRPLSELIASAIL